MSELTVMSCLFGQNPNLGHCPGIALVDTIAGMMNVQKPEIHGMATPTDVIQYFW